MSDTLRDIYRTLESRYVHKGKTIDLSFYNDLSDDSLAKFTAIKGVTIEFLQNKPIVAGARPEWLFDINMLTKSMNYVPIIAGTNFDNFVGIKDSIGAGQSNIETGSTQGYNFMPLWNDSLPLFDSSPKISHDAGKKHAEILDKQSRASNELNSAFENLNTEYRDDPKMPGLETIATYDDSE
nr:hypothetical protein [Tanacetum cinerariifolium]